MTEQKPLVAIVGRPNVGKSTLFNRVVGAPRAITSDEAGTTRDRIYADGEWQGRAFVFVDTGGLVSETAPDLEIQSAINDQVELALDEADAVLFVVDAQTGLVAEDEAIAAKLRPLRKPVLLVANKADNLRAAKEAVEFWELGLRELLPLSAKHGKGTGDLLERLAELLPGSPAAEVPRPDYPVVTIVGRANVGKSTLFNRFANTEQRITSATPHTTRDVASLDIATEAGPVRLLDTAGVQRRGKSGRGIPKFSLVRTLRAISEADVVCLLVDGEEGPTVQDAHIAAYVLEAGRSVVLAVNKWDKVTKSADIQEQFFAQLQDKLGFLPSPPVVFISALTGEKIERLSRAFYDVWRLAGTKVETAELNRFVRDNLDRMSGGKQHPKLFYLTQVGTYPPSFAVFVNKSSAWEENHRKWLGNLIREHYGLLGCPVDLKFRSRQPKEMVT